MDLCSANFNSNHDGGYNVLYMDGSADYYKDAGNTLQAAVSGTVAFDAQDATWNTVHR